MRALTRRGIHEVGATAGLVLALKGRAALQTLRGRSTLI